MRPTLVLDSRDRACPDPGPLAARLEGVLPMVDFERVQRSGERLGVFESPEFDFQLLRMLAGMSYGAATIGECLTTARAITDGDTDNWVTAWSETAGRGCAFTR